MRLDSGEQCKAFIAFVFVVVFASFFDFSLLNQEIIWQSIATYFIRFISCETNGKHNTERIDIPILHTYIIYIKFIQA